MSAENKLTQATEIEIESRGRPRIPRTQRAYRPHLVL